MAPSSDPAQRDRRTAAEDRRHGFRDRRSHGRRLTPSGAFGRMVGWATGPWTSANGLSWFRLILIIVVLQWGVIEFYLIPSSSMEPTLHGDPRFFSGDRVAVNKLVFGPRMPFAGTRLFRLGEPKRWDVVLFDSVSSASDQPVMVKRVVGLPGEHVEIRQKGVFINGELLEPPEHLRGILRYGLDPVDGDHQVRDLILTFASRGKIPVRLERSNDPRIEVLLEDLGTVRSKMPELIVDDLSGRERIELVKLLRLDSIAVVQEWWTKKVGGWGRPRYGVVRSAQYSNVPEGHYFCLGDNGPESHDSRYMGWVPHENLVGRAFAVAFPLSRLGDLNGFSKVPLGVLGLLSIPLAFLLWEVIPGFVVFSWRIRGTISALGLERGDHVVVNRLTLGLRLPFSTRRLMWRRDLRPGEVVCYPMARAGRGVTDFYFGEVREVSGEEYIVRGPGEGEDGENWLTLDRASIVGVVRSVWWPRDRRKKIPSFESNDAGVGS